MNKQKLTSSMKTRKFITNSIVHIILTILSLIWLFPIFWVVLTSFRGEKGSYISTFFPKSYTWDNYIRLFTDTSILNFPKMFVNTLVIAIFSCIISTFFVLSVSYCMSRLRFKMRKPFMNVAMILGLFPAFMSMVAVYYILKTLGLRNGGIEVVSCPTCGRTQIDLIGLANKVEDMVQDIPLDIKVAVMGCVVNGPGEAKEADIGIAGGKGVGLLIKKGEIIKKVPEDQLLETLRDELLHWNA